jgi:TonB family protein
VILRVLISASGKYIKHVVVKDPSAILTHAAEAMVQYVRFQPAFSHWEAVKYWVSIPFDYPIDESHLRDVLDEKSKDSIQNVPWPDPYATLEIVIDKLPEPINLLGFRGVTGYPALAKESEIEGEVILRVLVDNYGRYLKHIVLQDPHPMLTKAVTDKIEQLRFTPGIQNGKPVIWWVTVPFEFMLLK